LIGRHWLKNAGLTNINEHHGIKETQAGIHGGKRCNKTRTKAGSQARRNKLIASRSGIEYNAFEHCNCGKKKINRPYCF
jgi:hypothetical protein